MGPYAPFLSDASSRRRSPVPAGGAIRSAAGMEGGLLARIIRETLLERLESLMDSPFRV
jgi:hypothetical protein